MLRNLIESDRGDVRTKFEYETMNVVIAYIPDLVFPRLFLLCLGLNLETGAF